MTDYRESVQQKIQGNPFMPMSMAAAEVIREQILTCALMPGRRLKESEVAEALGVSRTTVRSAFDILLRSGMLVHTQKQGAFVAELSRTKYMKIAELRLMLDAFAGRLAAQRRTEADLAELRRQLDRLRETEQDAEYAQADIAFHSAVYSASKNEYLQEVAQVIGVDLLRAKMFGSSNMLAQKERVLKEHTAVYEAIAARSEKDAFELSRIHAKIMLDPQVMSATFGD